MEQVIIWWAGIVAVLCMLAVFIFLISKLLGELSHRCMMDLLRITTCKTARYWVLRMEKEGLTVIQDDYRKMVQDRKAKTPEDFIEIEKAIEEKELKN